MKFLYVFVLNIETPTNPTLKLVSEMRSFEIKLVSLNSDIFYFIHILD